MKEKNPLLDITRGTKSEADLAHEARLQEDYQLDTEAIEDLERRAVKGLTDAGVPKKEAQRQVATRITGGLYPPGDYFSHSE